MPASGNRCRHAFISSSSNTSITTPLNPHILAVLAVLMPACVLLQAREEGAPATGVVSLDVSESAGVLHLLLGVQDEAGARPRLEHLRSANAGAAWSAPTRVDAGNAAAVGLHRGMDAQIAASGDRLIAVWQTAGTDSWGGGPMTTALSHDAGKTWVRGANPADDGSTEGHNFIDIAADGKGTFHLVWLDTRAGRRGLRSTASLDHGAAWLPNRTVDPETCECCWNTLAARAEGGACVIYRGRSPRDMSVARLALDGGQPSAPVPVGAVSMGVPRLSPCGGRFVPRLEQNLARCDLERPREARRHSSSAFNR